MDEQKENLRSTINQARADFRARVGKDFSNKKRAHDMKEAFTLACRGKYKTLAIQWGQKQSALSRKLFDTYPPDILTQMIDRYVSNDTYHRERGLSFDGFYGASARIANDLAASENKAVAVQKVQQVTEPTEPKDEERKAFEQSAFYKKMPAIFREKMNATKGP